MADSSFGLKIGLEGERDFKCDISDINGEMRVLRSEMKLVASPFGGTSRLMMLAVNSKTPPSTPTALPSMSMTSAGSSTTPAESPASSVTFSKHTLIPKRSSQDGEPGSVTGLT